MRLDTFWGKIIIGCAALVLGTSAFAENVTVQASNFSFSPASVRIKPGDSVTWTNSSGTHNVAAASGLFGTGVASAPWQFSYTFQNVGKFSYVCQVHSYLGMGGNVLVRVTNAPPEVAITAPAVGSVFAANDPITISASANDDVQVASVEFLDGTTSVGIRTNAPYSFSITLSPGDHLITARAKDDENAVAETTVALKVLANHRPSVSIVEPLPDQVIFQPMPLNIRLGASDPEGPGLRVDYFLDDKPLATNTEALSLSVTNFVLGVSELKVIVTDAGGLSRNAGPVRIYLSERPQLAVSRPAGGFVTLTTSGVFFGTATLQYSPDMTPNSWIDLDKSSGPGSGHIEYSNIRLDHPHAYYRIFATQWE
jgi:plastocyanin